MENVSYSNPVPPTEYKCCGCGATGVKLWREYQPFGKIDLLCAKCAEKDQRKSHIRLDGWLKGPFWKSSFRRGDGDQIGWYIPAIPTENGIGYHGYSSVPQSGIDWWTAIPPLKK